MKSSLWSIDGALTGNTILGQSVSRSNDIEGLLHFLQSSRTEASPSDSSESYPGYSLWRESYPSAEMELTYSATPAD